MNTNKTLIEQQIEELKKLAEREEIMKKAREYRELEEIQTMNPAYGAKADITAITPSRAELNPNKSKTEDYKKLSFSGENIVFMKTINNEKTKYYHNSQVATVVFTNNIYAEVNIFINMKDVWINKGKVEENMYISKKAGTELYGSVMNEKGTYEYFTIKIENLLRWIEREKDINEYVEQ